MAVFTQRMTAVARAADGSAARTVGGERRLLQRQRRSFCGRNRSDGQTERIDWRCRDVNGDSCSIEIVCASTSRRDMRLRSTSAASASSSQRESEQSSPSSLSMGERFGNKEIHFSRPFARFDGQVIDSQDDSQLKQILESLRTIIDPDLDADIVTCGFVHDVVIEMLDAMDKPQDLNLKQDDVKNVNAYVVSLSLVLTTPACPIKEHFIQSSQQVLLALPWIEQANVSVSASASLKPIESTILESQSSTSLRYVKHIVAVSSCKGGVGKSTVAVNLAYSLQMMGARVGVFDADVYGPSLPTMTSPEQSVLAMDEETKAITPTEYAGVKLVSFGFAGQGAAIMRGPMVSGLVQQLLLTTEWGELDYLVIDMPPGTGDVQLTVCQDIPLSCAVIVTTPQKLSFIDVAKGIRMFSRLRVPCVAVVENMKYFSLGNDNQIVLNESHGVGDDVDASEKNTKGSSSKVYPFGRDSCGTRIANDFNIPHMYELPIDERISTCGDGGIPFVNREPNSDVADIFQNLGVSVVRECAKLSKQRPTVFFNNENYTITVTNLEKFKTFAVLTSTVREADRSSSAIDEWTGLPSVQQSNTSGEQEFCKIADIGVVGNYAIQITYEDGLNQVLPFEKLIILERVYTVDAAQTVPTT